MRASVQWALWVVVALGVAGCDLEEEGDEPLSPGKVQLGTGTTEWEPILPEQPLAFVMSDQQFGCADQGSYFIVHARIQGLVPGDPAVPGLVDNPTTQFSAFRQDGERVDLELPPYRLGYEEDELGFSVMYSGRLLLISYDEAPTIADQRVRLRVEVVDVDGRRAEDERWVIATPVSRSD